MTVFIIGNFVFCKALNELAGSISEQKYCDHCPKSTSGKLLSNEMTAWRGAPMIA
jgi:hypothetical protein